jgi:aryl-alcohol dehydrogenase-like predicted oxidoreductase
MKDKLIIGTANFGLEYGIANKRRLSREEVFSILEYASSQGIRGVDTAKVYGDAEKVIGEFFKEYGKVFNVITKLPKKEYKTTKDVEDEVFESMKDMNIEYIDFILLHSYETYKFYGKLIIPVLQSLCSDRIIGRYGVSVYHPEEVEDITGAVKDNFAIEFPLNLFDQRFLGRDIIHKLKSDGGFLFARSIFLQGLFFLDDKRLNGNFAKVKDKIGKIREISEKYNIKPECISLLFAAEKSWIDGVVIGIDSRKQLVANMECFSDGNLKKYKLIEPLLADMAVYDEEIILPYRWRQD